jgi:V-type H+-transporting ATPase subunit A
MLRNFVHFYECAQKAVTESGAQKVSWNMIKHNMPDMLYKLSSQKFQSPSDGQEKNVALSQALFDEITTAFRNLDMD